MKKFNLTLPEIKAVRDVKILEASILALIQNDEIISGIPTERYLEKILSNWIRLSKIRQSSGNRPGEEAVQFERYNKVCFPVELIKNNRLFPKFLGKNSKETHYEYINRIQRFIMDMDVKKIIEMLGELDPNDPKLNPTIKFMEALIKKKKNGGGCLIF